MQKVIGLLISSGGFYAVIETGRWLERGYPL